MQPTLSSAVADTPFRLQIAPGKAVAHPGWRQARAAVLAALGRGEAVALLGPPGTGKSLLLRDLAQALRHEGRSVRLVEHGDALASALRTDEILLIDEAGRMDADALARLCATDTPFVLSALPGFAERLDGLARPITPVTLGPLSPEAVARFVAARLAAAGRPRDMLDPDAVLALARHSEGLLRLVNVLGGAAVFLAETEQALRVGRRHVDEAASLRGDVDMVVAASVPTGAAASTAEAPLALPTTCSGSRSGSGAASATPPAEAVLARPTALPAWRRRAVVSAALTGLGLVLAGGWTASGWWVAQPPGARPADREGAARDSHSQVSDQRPGARPDDRVVDSSEDQAGDLPPLAGSAPRQRLAVSGTPVAFRGPVYNETMQQGGQMSLVIRRQGSSGAVTARFEAWGGLLGSGELAGRLSDDGHLLASGSLMVGKNPFLCDLSGLVAGGRLTGSASFVRTGGGRVAHSRFTLARS